MATAVFEFDPELEVWWWSEEMLQLHAVADNGTAPAPSRTALLAHVNPSSRDDVTRALHTAAWEREPAVVPYELTDDAGQRHLVVLTCEPDCETRFGVRGQLLDVTPLVTREAQLEAEEMIRRATSRAA